MLADFSGQVIAQKIRSNGLLAHGLAEQFVMGGVVLAHDVCLSSEGCGQRSGLEVAALQSNAAYVARLAQLAQDEPTPQGTATARQQHATCATSWTPHPTGQEVRAIDPFLELDNVSRHFSVRGRALETPQVLKAVDRVSLAVHKGETMGLVGESGCGKSTLARMVVRLLPPTVGEIRLGGDSVWNGGRSVRRSLPRRVQMIFQDPFSSLNPRMRVGSAIGEGLRIHNVGSAKERRERVLELLDRVGLSPEYAKRYPHEFSGGQRQRLAIARALALDPDLVVCDEPVSALDVSIQAQVLNLLGRLQQTLGLTYFFISHDLSVVSHIADRVAVMYLGRLVELAPSKELYTRPAHPYTRALLAAVPKPDPSIRVTATDGEELSGDIPSPVNAPAGCPFHPRCPEAMEVCSEKDPSWLEISPGHHAACFLYGE